MKNIHVLLLVVFLHLFAAYETKGQDSTQCDGSCCKRADDLAPAGIMVDHVHEKGKFGIAYGYMNMAMQGNQSGTAKINDAVVFNTYIMSPNKMNMQMHMLMPMYGITNRLTVMAMINYNLNSMGMNHIPVPDPSTLPPCCRPLGNSTTSPLSKSAGFGDTKLYALYSVLPANRHRLVAGLGISLPTGSIHAKGATVVSYYSILSYNMQLGTGTYNLLPSLVYTAQLNRFTFGIAAQSNIKLGVNAHNYSWGNEYSFSPWAACKVTSWASISLRAEGYYQGGMYGYDAGINLGSNNDPSANVYNYGSRKLINALAGVNLYAPKTCLKGLHFLVEYGMPVYQNLQGLPLPEGKALQEFQMSAKSTFTARLQYNF